MDRFKKYKHSKIVNEDDDKSYQNSGGEDETKANFAINQSSDEEEDKIEIFEESKDFSKDQVFDKLKMALNRRKNRGQISFDQNLLKSFKFDQKINQSLSNLNINRNEESVSIFEEKIQKFESQKLEFKNYFETCNLRYEIQENNNHNSYINDEYIKVKDWQKTGYSNPNESSQYVCTQFFEPEKLKQRYLLIYTIQKLVQNDKNCSHIFACTIMKYDFNTQIFQKVTSQLLDIVHKAESLQFLTMSRIFINKESTFIYKKQKEEIYGFQLFRFFNKNTGKSQKNENQISKNTDENIDLEQIEEYNIDLPNELKYNLEDLDICFIQKTSQSRDDSLENQFVIITSHQYADHIKKILLIYSLKDTSKPIVKFTKGELYKCSYAFYTQKDKDTISFILMSRISNTFTVINYKESEGVIQADTQNYQILNDLRITQESNYQTYYPRYNNMQVDPLETKVKLPKSEEFIQSYFIDLEGRVMLIYPHQENLQKQKVIEFIHNKHKINGEDKVFTLYFNDEISYSNIKKQDDQIVSFLNDKGSQHSNLNTYRLFTEDLAIIMSYQGVLETLSFNLEKADITKVQKIEKYEKCQKKNKILRQTLAQFDCWLQPETYQDNYGKSISMIINQYTNNLYMNRNFKGVLSTHNQCLIGNQAFKFNQNYLIMDLSQVISSQDQQFQLVQLYYQSYTPCKNLKLVKYFVTQSAAIFFFMYRKDTKGFYFMVAIKLVDLSKRDYVIKQDSQILYFEDNTSIKVEQFNEQTIVKYQSLDKHPNFTKQQLIFEIIKDQAEPKSKYIPFIFHSKVATKMFDHYFCWIDAEKICQVNLKDGQNTLNFSEYIASFKIDYYQKQDEPDQYEKCTEENSGMRMDIISKQKRSQNMFTRSSNWSKNEKTNKVSARYMVGNNIRAGGIDSIEIKEFLVHLDLQEMDKIELKLIHLKYLTFNEGYINSVKSSYENMNPIENNRLVPKIDDNGNIVGVLALISNQQYLNGIHKITSDIEVIQNHYKDQEDTLNLLIQNASQDIYIQLQRGDVYDAFLTDGTFIQGFKKEILQDQTRKFARAYVYHSFDISDDQEYSQQFNCIQNDIVNINVKKSKFGFLSTIKLSEKAINENYFNNQESNYWLYQYSKTALTMRMSFGFDFLFEQSNEINYQILQPQYKLNGQNQLFQIIQDLTVQQIDELFHLIQKQDTNFIYLKNSVLHCAHDKKSKNPIERFASSLDLYHNYDLQADMLNLKSIIQCLHQLNKSKELKYLIKQIIKTKGSQNYSKIIVYDLPNIMMNKIEFYEFMIFDSDEQDIVRKNQSNYEIQQLCNLEIILNPELQIKDFGQKQIICSELMKLENFHFNKKDIFEIIKNFKEKEVQKNVQVEYSRIDFTHFCRLMNLFKIQGRLHEIIEDKSLLQLIQNEDILKCSWLFLSNLINFYQGDPIMFEQKTIQTLIDSQFQTITRPFIKMLLAIYFSLFLVPFVYNNISENLIIKESQTESQYHLQTRFYLNVLAFCTQIAFTFLEIIEIRFIGFNKYFSSAYNWFDFSQPLIFTGHLIIKMYVDPKEFGTLKVFDNLVQLLIILGSFSKMLQYIRYNEQYCMFVNIFYKVLQELKPFITSFLVFTIVFGFVIILMQADVDNKDDEYVNMSLLFESFIQVFRSSLGDVKVIKYNWDENKPAAYTMSLVIIWLSWIFNILVMQIIMLNIVIVQVGQSFEKVMALGESSIYMERAQLNEQILQIYFYFGKKKQFFSLVFQKPAENQDKKMDEFTTFSERIKKNTKKLIENLQKNIIVNQNNQQIELKKEIFALKEQMEKDIEMLKKDFKKMDQGIQSLNNDNHIVKNENQVQIFDNLMLMGENKSLKQDIQSMMDILKSIQGSLNP